MVELFAVIEGIRERETKEFRRNASLQGINLDSPENEEDPITRIKRRLAGDDPEINDVKGLIKAPSLQQELGFDLGLGYIED